MSEQYAVESLNAEQKQAYDCLENTRHNYYITGRAGTGKSYLLRTFVKNTGKRVAVVAPTGIAAVHVGGQTIHSFFGLSTSIQAAYDPDAVHKGLSETRLKILRNLDTLIVDEVSMVRVDVMDMIDAKLKAARGSDAPFGGMWDYVMERDDQTVMVFEMKTTGVNQRKYWEQNLPNKYVVQAALYAWLLKIDYFCMVCSFLEKKDYDEPEKYECNGSNTFYRVLQVSKFYSNFEKQVILPAMEWWDRYIETGVSPEYDEERDKAILDQLRQMTEQEEEGEKDGTD